MASNQPGIRIKDLKRKLCNFCGKSVSRSYYYYYGHNKGLCTNKTTSSEQPFERQHERQQLPSSSYPYEFQQNGENFDNSDDYLSTEGMMLFIRK